MTPATPAAVPNLARLHNDLRQAERDWQRHSSTDRWPGGNPWAAHRDEAAARHDRLSAQLTAAIAREDRRVARDVDLVHAVAGMGA